MPFSNDLSVRKHAQNYLRQLDVKHLQDYKISSQKTETRINLWGKQQNVP